MSQSPFMLEAPLNVDELSTLPRFGIKGAGAADWLAGQGIPVPHQPNSWLVHDQTLVMRLGLTEFLLEDQSAGGHASRLLAAGTGGYTSRVYPVARVDAAYAVSGSQSLALFTELCALDLPAELATPDRLLMTQLAGISVVLLHIAQDGNTVFRLWCDGTYGNYLGHVLSDIANEFIDSTHSSNASATFKQGVSA